MYQSYVYKIINKITNQFYIGARSKNVELERYPEDDLWIHYFSSSKRVRELISKFGRESFDYEIISKHNDDLECFFEENKIIFEHIEDPMCLNGYCLSPVTGMKIFSFSGRKHSVSAKSKISTANTGNTPHNKNKETPSEVREKQSIAAKNRPPMSEETKKKMSESRTGDKNPRGMLGKTASEETKKKLSQALTGKNIGKVHGKQSKETLEKRFAHRRGVARPKAECPQCGKIGGATQMIQWHFDNCKFKNE